MFFMNGNILVIGACGQLGTELTSALIRRYGAEHVIATDVRTPAYLDVLDKSALTKMVTEREITQIYLLAALLSATGERFPQDGQGFLAQQHRGIRAGFSQKELSAGHRDGTHHRVWHQ